MNKLALLLLFTTTMTFAQKDTAKEAFLEKWINSKEYLLELAEAMPEEHFNFKPTEREMDFGSQLLHIRGNMEWLGNTYFTNKAFDKASLSKDVPEGKKAIIVALKASFEKVYSFIENTPDADLETTVDFFAGPKSKLQILNLLQDHVTHHRGQLIVYLNLNEIKPPAYRGW